MKDHSWFEEKLEKASNKKSLYNHIEYTFNNYFSIELGKLSDEVLLELIPYLNEDSKNELLNLYNRSNQSVIKELLVHEALFYIKPSQRHHRKNDFHYSVIDFRTAQEKENRRSIDNSKFDMVKTMQFKMLFNI